VIDRFLLLVPRSPEAARRVHYARAGLVASGAIERPIGCGTLFVGAQTQVVDHLPSGSTVIGSLFRRDDNAGVDRFRPGEGFTVAASRGARLIDGFWGSYVALFALADNAVSVLRDPSAGLPAYYRREADLDIVFSDLAIARAAGLRLSDIDWDALAHRLRFPILRIARTGFSNITELLPGQTITLDEKPSTLRSLWSPWQFVQNRNADGAADTEAVRTAVTTSVAALARRFDTIQLELSGGLDSSIVAASLSQACTTWHGLTFSTRHSDGDERLYARAVAAHLGVALNEIELDETAADPLHLPVRPRVSPGGFSVLAASDARLSACARDSGAQAIFTGAGGDNVFCTINSAAPVVDAVRRAGVAQVWATLNDVAILNDTSLYDAARHTVRQALRPDARRPAWPVVDTLLASGGTVPFAGHPWLDAPVDALPGKRTHIAALLRIMPFLDGYDRAFDLPMIAPLMAQPVMEACLAIPTWRWIASGRDRVVARRAFADALPAQITQRRTKGSLASTFAPIFERNRDALCDLLVGGRLADRGIVDAGRIEALLGAEATRDASYVRLLEIADIELWIRATQASAR
jgi:asparagine synthase (glutamine-hydrolysing)